MLDHKLKPWLLEINYRPSLTTDTPLDLKIKQGLVRDTLSLMKVPSIVKIDMYVAERERKKDRMFNGAFRKLSFEKK